MKNLMMGSLLALSLSACDSLWMDETATADPASLVVQVWEEINENYVFFDQKGVDWASALTRYQAQVSADMSEEELFEVLANMLRELEDGHVSLQAGFNNFRYHEVYLDFESNYNPGVVERVYLDRKINELGPFVYAILNGEVGYLRYGSFGDDFTQEQLVYLMDYFFSTRSLVIDIRDNLGGAAGNVTGLLGLFITEPQTVGQQHMPDGQGGYTVTDISVEPNEEIAAYENPVIILTNRKSYSSAHAFPGFMS
ncbi:MAG TPA: hypothetical protein DCR93_13895, partial [Cytophagales bacterium]|nr:hypothetical protein [Cytophagales bacterium]